MIGNKKSSVSTIKFNEEKLESIVSSNIIIEGKFSSTGNIRLDCKIVGEVNSESIYVGESCNIKGTVNCDNIVISGKIEGNVACRGKMHIKETGVVDGDITVNLLSMDEGSMFTGNCIRVKQADKISQASNKDIKNNINQDQNKDKK